MWFVIRREREFVRLPRLSAMAGWRGVAAGSVNFSV